MFKKNTETKPQLTVSITNYTNTPIQCAELHCDCFADMRLGEILLPQETKDYHSHSNGRIFCEWYGIVNSKKYRFAVTAPKNLRARACGYNSFGLQPYEITTPTTFTFHVGRKDKADWTHSHVNTGIEAPWKDCE